MYVCMFVQFNWKKRNKKKKEVRLNHMIYIRPRFIGYLFSTIKLYKICTAFKAVANVCMMNRKKTHSSYGHLNGKKKMLDNHETCSNDISDR